jgi:putative flippase GtrA
VGGINTAVSFALFALFEQFTRHQFAYTLAYALGIAISFLMNSRLVFGTPLSAGNALRFPLVYGVQYLYGLAAMTILVDVLKLHSYVAIALVIATSVPISFVLSRRLLRPAAAGK